MIRAFLGDLIGALALFALLGTGLFFAAAFQPQSNHWEQPE